MLPKLLSYADIRSGTIRTQASTSLRAAPSLFEVKRRQCRERLDELGPRELCRALNSAPLSIMKRFEIRSFFGYGLLLARRERERWFIHFRGDKPRFQARVSRTSLIQLRYCWAGILLWIRGRDIIISIIVCFFSRERLGRMDTLANELRLQKLLSRGLERIEPRRKGCR